MERAIAARAETNRERYGKPSRSSQIYVRPNQTSNESGSVGAAGVNGKDGQSVELHTLEDSDAQRRFIDAGGHRSSARRLRRLWGDEFGAEGASSASSPAGPQREQGHTRGRRPWDSNHATGENRDNGLPDRRTARADLHQKTLEEYIDERWSDTVRGRIATLRRNFIEADRTIGRALETLRRGIETLRKYFETARALERANAFDNTYHTARSQSKMSFSKPKTTPTDPQM